MTDIEKTKVKLVDWSIFADLFHGYGIGGVVSGHPRLPDGSTLGSTSSVLSVKVDCEKRVVVFETRNTLYEAEFDTYNPTMLEECLKRLRKKPQLKTVTYENGKEIAEIDVELSNAFWESMQATKPVFEDIINTY